MIPTRKPVRSVQPGDSIVFSNTLTLPVIALLPQTGPQITLLLQDRRARHSNQPFRCNFDRNRRVRVIPGSETVSA